MNNINKEMFYSGYIENNFLNFENTPFTKHEIIEIIEYISININHSIEYIISDVSINIDEVKKFLPRLRHIYITKNE